MPGSQLLTSSIHDISCCSDIVYLEEKERYCMSILFCVHCNFVTKETSVMLLKCFTNTG